MGVLDGITFSSWRACRRPRCPACSSRTWAPTCSRSRRPSRSAGSPEAQRRAAFAFVNRNKRSLSLNLKAPEGQAIFRKLAAEADVLVEGFRPGVMKRLGADYETIRALNPRVVYCSLSGFGQDGPYRDYPAHDMNYLSLAGVLGLIGDADASRRSRSTSWPTTRAPACTARSAS